jgi:hypothetical protein
MSDELIVSGTMQEIVGKLNLLLEVVKNREATGWAALQGDENWQFISMGDQRVCPLCLAMEAIGNFVGSEVPAKFPFYEILEDALILPHVHTDPPCRCHLEWPDAAQVCEARLHEEKLVASRG